MRKRPGGHDGTPTDRVHVGDGVGALFQRIASVVATARRAALLKTGCSPKWTQDFPRFPTISRDFL